MEPLQTLTRQGAPLLVNCTANSVDVTTVSKASLKTLDHLR